MGYVTKKEVACSSCGRIIRKNELQYGPRERRICRDCCAREHRLLRFLSSILTIVLILLFIFVLYSVAAMLILPTNDEYKGEFPTEPELFSDEFWTALRNGIIRHIALLNDHVTSPRLLGIVGLIFTTLLVFRVKSKVVNMCKGELGMQIHEYVELGFGSMISAIIYLSGNLRYYPHYLNMIILLTISAFILYLIHKDLGLLSAIKDWIRGKTPEKKQKE